VVVWGGFGAGAARANHSFANACAGALDPAVCERLTAIHYHVSESEALAQAMYSDYTNESGRVPVIIKGVSIPPGAFEERTDSELPVADGTLRELTDMDGETSTSTKVRLSQTDRDWLKFTGWGVWVSIGVLLCLLLADQWHRAWRWFSS
jgi:hypothetical protein